MIRFSAYKELQTSDGRMPLDVSIEINRGELVSLYGNSGAGKTTILRLLAGLTAATKVFTEANGQIWDDSENKIFVVPQKRSVGFVFQDFALFPNFNLRENIEFALPPGQDKRFVDELIESLELGALQKNKPIHLSGGQRQRVALARAIARKPKLLLLDEPLSSLDDEMRHKLQQFIVRVHKEFGLTTILVSHHLPEIYKLSHKIFHLEKGRIVNSGVASEIFREENVSAQLNLEGEVLSVEPSDHSYVVSILAGNKILKVLAAKNEVQNLKPGQKLISLNGRLNK